MTTGHRHSAGAKDRGEQPARCLDITRLIRRAGRAMTGVDRVEFAYLRHLSAANGEFHALARTRLGYVLLDKTGARALCDRIAVDDWGAPDALARLGGGDTFRSRAEADLRRLALARCVPLGLRAMLMTHLPDGVTWLNTGHSNLTKRVIAAIKSVTSARIAVLVHDTIPLDHPEYQRPGTQKKFAGFLHRAAQSADLVICNSEATLRDVRRHMTGRVPDAIVAPLGVECVAPGVTAKRPDAPFFLCVGTIEPRKNHALLLDIWDRFAAAGRTEPHLVICGARGWNNHAVFARLDAGGNPLVHEYAGLSDAEIAALLQQSRGLLFPSFAEGFGLPPVEAAAMGVPVVCSDLPVYREVMQDIPIYLSPSDRYSWEKTIEKLTEQRPSHVHFDPPTWDRHFNIVLRSDC